MSLMINIPPPSDLHLPIMKKKKNYNHLPSLWITSTFPLSLTPVLEMVVLFASFIFNNKR